MRKETRLYIIVFLASILTLLFLAGSAVAAYEVKVNLGIIGGGTGKVTFSATSSHDFEFFGWSGESCIGNKFCILMGLVPNSSKVVTASFNAPVCVEFTYSEFGTCQLDGMAHRSVVSAGPPGCVGGNPIISRGCFYDPCEEYLSKSQNVPIGDQNRSVVDTSTWGSWDNSNLKTQADIDIYNRNLIEILKSEEIFNEPIVIGATHDKDIASPVAPEYDPGRDDFDSTPLWSSPKNDTEACRK